MTEVEQHLAPFHFSQIQLDPPKRLTFTMHPFKTFFEGMRLIYRHMRHKEWRQAERHYNEGLRAHSIGMFIEAEAAYRECLDLEPAHEPAHTNLAALYLQRQNLEEAESHIRLAIEARPHYHRGYYNLALLLMHLEENDEAISWFQESLNRSPKHFWSLVNLAEVHANRNEMDQAIEFYERALATGNEQHAVYQRLSELHFVRRDFPASERCLEEMLRRRKSAETYYNLAWIMVARQDHIEKAIEHLEQALNYSANYREALFNLALVLSIAGKNTESVTRMNQYMDAYVERDSDEYLQHLRLLTRINPQNYVALLKVAELHLKANRINDAIEELEWLLERNAKVEPALEMLGNIHLDQANHKEALRTYRKLVEAAPEKVPGYLGIAKSYGAIENYAAAKPVIRKVLDLDPNNPELHYQYATLLAQDGDLREAANHYRIVAKLRPTYPRIEKRIRMVEAELAEQETEKPKAWPLARTIKGR